MWLGIVKVRVKFQIGSWLLGGGPESWAEGIFGRGKLVSILSIEWAKQQKNWDVPQEMFATECIVNIGSGCVCVWRARVCFAGLYKTYD